LVDSFVYLGSSVDASGGNDSDIRRRIELHEIACMKSLDRGIWRYSILLVTKLKLYNVYILPVLLYGSDTWSVTEASRRLDAFDQWCLRRILRIPYIAHVTNVSVRSQTEQPPVSSLIQQRRLKLFGHIVRAAASEDHSRALRASTDRLPVDWRCPRA